MWIETRRNVNTVIRNFDLSERPWVILAELADRPVIEAGRPIVINAIIKNVGRSVARHIFFYSAIDADAPKRSALGPPVFDTHPAATLGVIAPEAIHPVRIDIVVLPPLTPEQLATWSRPDCPTSLRLFSYFEYWSDSDGRHGGTICLEYDPRAPKLFDICGSDGW